MNWKRIAFRLPALVMTAAPSFQLVLLAVPNYQPTWLSVFIPQLCAAMFAWFYTIEAEKTQ